MGLSGDAPDGRNVFRDFLEKRLVEMGYGDYPAQLQRCTLTVDRDAIFSPIQQTACTAIYRFSGH